jgi:hypothetical protein
MKRGVVAAVAVLAMAVGASAADAAVKKGRFVGKSTKGDPFGLKVNGSERVQRFYFEGVRLRCSDDTVVDTPSGRRKRFETPAGFSVPIQERRWGIQTTNEDETGLGWETAGRFNKRGTKVTGTFDIFALFNDQGEQDPNGSVRCEANNLSFTLRRQ